ncbi:hypothetical protein [uncultured Methylophaga sp.]|uniref:hypothetical protein n=1 Tax=uncultured Methylophaga sp. TaxID=285271 RepID=UPI0026246E3D|nr:hypothetical protein [uncultured Methylophaga sp.]
MEVTKVPVLRLPQHLPHAEAIRSFKDNQHSYEAEFWEYQYQTYRYLERLSEESLITRYADILKNMQALISEDRHVIPIQSFLSSWYWFRKEHQTRFEFYLRGLKLPSPAPLDITFNNVEIGAVVRPKHPNSGDVLFRYDKQVHLDGIANLGVIRIQPASNFQDYDHNSARQDEEQSKKHYLPGGYTRITTENGASIPIIGDVERMVTMPNYYIFCMSCDWDQGLFSDFDGDACLIIKNVEEFSRRLECAATSHLAGWYFHHNPVQYFDPYERTKNEYLEATMSKDFRFAYQREYRFLWFPQNGEEPNGFKFLDLGSLSDFAEVRAQQVAPADLGSATLHQDV